MSSIAIAKGLNKPSFDEVAERLLRTIDDVADDVGDSIDCSFSEDTPMSTEESLQAIGSLEAGDYVLAYDETTGEIGYYPIVGVWINEDPVIVYLTIDGELIETTPEHPFYTVDGEWVAASNLQVGDEIRQADSNYGIVEAVEFVHQQQAMYNFTVADAHTYFVGDGQWLVHNVCPKPRKLHAALGINDTGQLFGFANNTRSHWYGTWHEGDLLDYPVSSANFDSEFKTAMDRATEIHFNLDDIRGDLEAFRQLGASGKFGGAPWTATELYLVTTNPAWQAKTTFYRNGAKLPTSPFKP